MNMHHMASPDHHAQAGRSTKYQTTGRTIHWARLYDVVIQLALRSGLRGLREQTIDLMALRPGDRVLDVGCGTGDLALAAWRRVGPQGKVYGIDAAAEMVETARRKAARAHAPMEFRVEPVERLTFADRTFDVVVSSMMLHHLPGALQPQAVTEMLRVLRPGGRLVIVDFPISGPDPRTLIGRMHRRAAPAPTAHAGQPAAHPAHAQHAGHADHADHAVQPAPPTVGLGAVPSWLAAAGLVEISSGDLPVQRLAYVRGRLPT